MQMFLYLWRCRSRPHGSAARGRTRGQPPGARYGDILSDAGAALVGGLGLAASANLGESFCLAEPVHGSAPDIAGQGIANPVATFRAAALLLRHLGLQEGADAVEEAIDSVLATGPRTPDLGGRATTVRVAEAVLDAFLHS